MGGVLVAAIVVVAMAMVLTRPTPTELQAASTRASASPSGDESASAIPPTTSSPSATPSPTPSLGSSSASPAPSDMVTPSPMATADPTSTPEPTPTPITTVAGTWSRLPLLPDTGHFEVASAVVLDDGRLVVFRWRTCCTGQSVIVLEPGATAWTFPALSSPLVIGTGDSFAVGADGRIYGWRVVIDPSEDPWLVQPHSMTGPTEVTEALRFARGPDDRLYFPHEETITSSTTRLRAYDPSSHAVADVSTTDLGYFNTILGGVDLLYATGWSGLIATYDVTRDAWQAVADSPSSLPSDVFIGPDDSLWVRDPEILVWDETVASWLKAGRPLSITGPWDPFLASGGDRIYAIDDQAAVFIPDNP